MALVKYDSMDEEFRQHLADMRADGQCAHAWTVPEPDNAVFEIAVACVKKTGHLGDHRAWGGHVKENSRTSKRSNKS
jgi:hypothetical protein